MADVSKIKLPDNTEVNIKDSRISSIDSTPTSGSVNPVTSGGVYAAIPRTTSSLTNDSGFRKITVSSSEPTSSDGADGDIWIVI